jgi:hypothetical protein
MTLSSDEVDALFKLAPEEFTAARNALVTRLKKSGRRDEAEQVKALRKPTITVWAVNQLYWKHPKAFDRLIASGNRLFETQASQFAGKAADLRGALDARRDAMSDLLALAAELLRDAGHHPTPDKMLRITTNLEAISTFGSRPAGPVAGRLSNDLDPPGFDSFAALISGAIPTPRPQVHLAPAPPLETTHPARPAADSRLLAAERSLAAAQARSRDAEAAMRDTAGLAEKTEQQRREAEQRFHQAAAAAEEARRRAESAAAEAVQARKDVEEAERALKRLRRTLEESV